MQTPACRQGLLRIQADVFIRDIRNYLFVYVPMALSMRNLFLLRFAVKLNPESKEATAVRLWSFTKFYCFFTINH